MKKFIILGIMSEAVYLLLYVLINYEKNINTSVFTGLENLKNNVIIYFSLTALLLCAFLFYLLAFKYFRNDIVNIKFKTIFIFTVLFSLTLFILPPWPSTDVFTYINQSRKFSDFGHNPYINKTDIFEADDWRNVKMTSWSVSPSVYGPTFIRLGSILTGLSHKNFICATYLFKLAFLFAHLLLVFLLYKSFGKTASFLYAWNPLINFEFILNGHNDVLIILLLALSIIIIHKNKNLLSILASWLFLLLSVFIKYSTLIYVPFFYFAYIVFSRNKMKFVALSFLSGFSLTAWLFAPFWIGIEGISPIKHYAYGNVSAFASIAITFTAMLIFYLQGSASLSVNIIFYWARNLCLLLFLIIYSYQFFRFFKERLNLSVAKLLDRTVKITIAFFLLALTWLMPWYLSQLIILAIIAYAIKKEEKYLAIIKITSLYGIFYNLILK